MNDIECPYCGYEMEVCHDDGFGYEEGVPHEMECSECEKSFAFYTTISFDYEAIETPCKNGDADHLGCNTIYGFFADDDQLCYKSKCSLCGIEVDDRKGNPLDHQEAK